MSVLAETTFTDKRETRAIVDEVVEHAFQSVCSTMGPNGNYVVINQINKAKVTKDGVSVAKALDFNEARRNLIAEIIKEPSMKTDAEVGDGTTTTIFQMYHLYNAFKDEMSFKNIRYLDQLMAEVKNHLLTLIEPGDLTNPNFRSMLLTTSNYEESIVNMVMRIYKDIKNPNIQLMKAPQLKEDEIEQTDDIFFDGKPGNDIFSPNKLGGNTLGSHNFSVVFVDGYVNYIPADVMQHICYGTPNVPTILVARNFDNVAINAILNMNRELNRLAILPYTLAAGGTLGTTLFEDISKLFDTQPVYDITAVTPKDVKVSDISVMLKDNGFYLDKQDPVVAERADSILEVIDERYEAMGVLERQTPVGTFLYKRISRLRANNVIIKVTGVTYSDAMERYYRYEDVMKAARTGLQFGVIKGIGFGYMSASEHLKTLPVQSDEGLEQLRRKLITILTYQYSHLTRIYSVDEDFGKYVDLVTGEVSDSPQTVFDNAAATMIALEGAWSTAKTLSKINNIMGRSNTSYV